MQKLQNTFYWAIIATETSHVFCCVLPTVFSILSFMAGLGLIGIVPVWMQDAHTFMHNWEVPIIAFSGFVVALGWGVFYLGQKSECHNEECSHGCGSKGNASKKAASIVLKAATALFIANLLIYAVFHKGLGFSASSVYEQTAVHEADHEHRN